MPSNDVLRCSNHGKLMGPNNCNKGRVLIFAPLMGAGFVFVSSKCRRVDATKLCIFFTTRILFQTPGIIAAASWFGRTQGRWNILDLKMFVYDGRGCMHAHPCSFQKSRMSISIAALRGMIGGHFGPSNGLPVLT